MSEFDFDSAGGTPADNFNLDPAIVNMFTDPDFSFSQDTALRLDPEPAPPAAAPVPPVADHVPRRPAATPLRPDRSPADAIRQPADAPARAAVAPAARTVSGQAFREPADRLLQNLYQQRVDRERLIDNLTKEKQQLQIRLQEYRSQFECADSEKRKVMFELKEKTAELAAQQKACDELRVSQESLRVRVADVEKDCRQFEECKLLFEKSSVAKEKMLKKQAEQYTSHMSLVADDLTDLKKTTADLKSQLSAANEQVAQRGRDCERAEQQYAQSLTELRDQCAADMTSLRAAFAAKETSLLAAKSELEERVANLTAERDSLTAENMALAEVRSELAACEEELSAVQDEYRQICEQKEIADQKAQTLERGLAESQATFVELNGDYGQLQRELNQAQLNYEERIQTVSQDLQTACRLSEDEVAELRSEVQRLTIRMQLLESEKAAAVTRSAELQAENQVVEQRQTQLQLELTELNQKLSSDKSRTDAALEAAEQEKLSAEQKVAARDAELLASANGLKQKEEELGKAVEERARLTEELGRKNELLAAAEKEHSGAAAKIEQVEEQLHQALKENSQWQQKERTWEQAEAGFRRRLKEDDTLLDQKNDEIETLRAKNVKLEERLTKGTTPAVHHSPSKRKAGRRALAFDDDTEEEDFVPKRAKQTAATPNKQPEKKQQAEKKVPEKKKQAEKKKPAAKKADKKQEDVYRNFADASAGDCAASRRKLPVASTSSKQNSGNNADDSEIEWF